MKLHEWQESMRAGEGLPGLAERACHGKVRYFFREDAVDGIAVLRRRDGARRVIPYRCDDCGSWHIGHMPYTVKVYPPAIRLPFWLMLANRLRAALP